jgi:hypothetical protein
MTSAMKKTNIKLISLLQIFFWMVVAIQFIGCKEDVSLVSKKSFIPIKKPQLVWSITDKTDSVLKVEVLLTDSGSRVINKIDFEYFEDSLYSLNKKSITLNPIIDKPLVIDIIELRQIKKYWGRVVITTDVGPITFIPRELNVAGPKYPPNTVHCDAFNPTIVKSVLNPTTGRIWMDRNLGASRIATDKNDAQSYGDLYQWGRRADGHQCRNSTITNIPSSSDQPQQGVFITSSTDWRNPGNNDLWQGVSGINNPCPDGFRIPTEGEFNAEMMSWSVSNAEGAFASPLRLPSSGYRDQDNGSLGNFGGEYWSSTIVSVFSSVSSRNLSFNSSVSKLNVAPRSNGFAVRCIKQ